MEQRAETHLPPDPVRSKADTEEEKKKTKARKMEISQVSSRTPLARLQPAAHLQLFKHGALPPPAIIDLRSTTLQASLPRPSAIDLRSASLAAPTFLGFSII